MSGPGGAAEVVDAHHHVWDLAVRPQPWIDPVGMAPIARSFGAADLHEAAAGLGATGRARVVAAVVVQTVRDAAETPELLDLAAADPLVAAAVGWVDLTGDDPRELAALALDPARPLLAGVRAQAQEEPDPGWLDRPDVRAGIAAAGRAGLVVDLLVTARQLPAAVRCVHDLDGVRFVLDHLGKPPVAAGHLQPWAGRLRELARAPHVVAKVSGLVTEADTSGWSAPQLRPWVQVALEAFGPDRLAVGSDWPVCLLAGSYADVLGATLECLAPLSGAERAAVLAGTARRVYALPGPGAPRDPRP
ncbi:amidohydrolase family protein [Kineococcus glutinatus]|uniref:Amidohydrolase family protein n=1 Tax=Kineococcus glutinatus TaxID=1070872 RepID=A0ABP9I3G0_9ACTN